MDDYSTLNFNDKYTHTDGGDDEGEQTSKVTAYKKKRVGYHISGYLKDYDSSLLEVF